MKRLIYLKFLHNFPFLTESVVAESVVVIKKLLQMQVRLAFDPSTPSGLFHPY